MSRVRLSWSGIAPPPRAPPRANLCKGAHRSKAKFPQLASNVFDALGAKPEKVRRGRMTLSISET